MRETPPEFRVQMRDLTINVGEPATFDCQITGCPKPDVFWAKVGTMISFLTKLLHFLSRNG